MISVVYWWPSHAFSKSPGLRVPSKLTAGVASHNLAGRYTSSRLGKYERSTGRSGCRKPKYKARTAERGMENERKAFVV